MSQNNYVPRNASSDKMFSKAFNPHRKPTASIDHLSKSIPIVREALDIIPHDNEQRRAHCLAWLIVLYNRKYHATGDAADLDTVVEYTRAFVNLIPRDNVYRASRLNDLGVCLEERYTRTGRIEDLQEAMIVIQEAVDLVQREGGPVIHLDVQVRNLHDLGILFGRKYSITGATADIDMGISSLEQAVRTEVDPVKKAICLMSLSNRYADKYYKEGRSVCLGCSIDLMVQVAVLVPESYNDAGYLHNLAFLFADRYMLTGSTTTLDTTISLAKKAVELTPEQSSYRALYLNTFARALGLRSVWLNTMGDLDEAIRAAREAMDITPNDHPNRITYLSGLEIWLGYRYGAQGSMPDLEDAINLAREIVGLTSDEDPKRPRRVHDFGFRMLQRCTRRLAGTGQPQQHLAIFSDLNEAIQSFQEAIRRTPENDPDKVVYLGNLQQAVEYSRLRTGADPDHRGNS
ncbi:hypothetical protein F4782DRAFT_509277 [Xylaria castorea]|nr:hypothetical protein F4782DRAFT_509277 [Xylaria castorea]